MEESELLALLTEASKMPEFCDYMPGRACSGFRQVQSSDQVEITNKIFNGEDGFFGNYLKGGMPLASDFDRFEIVHRDECEIWIPFGFYAEVMEAFVDSVPSEIRDDVRQLFCMWEADSAEEDPEWHIVPVDLYSASHFVLAVLEAGGQIQRKPLDS